MSPQDFEGEQRYIELERSMIVHPFIEFFIMINPSTYCLIRSTIHGSF